MTAAVRPAGTAAAGSAASPTSVPTAGKPPAATVRGCGGNLLSVITGLAVECQT